MIGDFNKYFNEKPELRKGLYSEFDSNYLYSVVRKYKPRTIIDFAPREGRTTSCIINAIIKNLSELECDVKYYIFEKDVLFLTSIVEYLNKIVNENGLQNKIQIFYDENIIDSKLLIDIKNVDLLFIDANHDYILAKWYVEHLFNKVNVGGIIHIHDVYYNKNGNGWYDARMLTDRNSHNHPDFTDVRVMRRLYPTIFDKYFDGKIPVIKYEQDIIEEFYLKNEKNVEMYSTLDIGKNGGMHHEFNCSLYFIVRKVLVC